MPNFKNKPPKASFLKNFLLDRHLIIFIAIILVVAINQIVFSVLLVDRTRVQAIGGTFGNTAIGTNDYPLYSTLEYKNMYNGQLGPVGNNPYAEFTNAVVNPNTGYAWVMNDQVITEYSLNDNLYTKAVSAQGGDGILKTLILDTINEYLYVGTDNGRLIKYDVDSSTHALTRIGYKQFLSPPETFIGTGLVDEANQLAYFSSDPGGFIHKIDLNAPGSPCDDNPAVDCGFALVDSISDINLQSASSATIDLPDGTPEHGQAYFYSDASRKLTKIDIDPARTFELVDQIDIFTGSNLAESMVMDAGNGYLYIGTGGLSPGIPEIIKVDMGNYPGRSFAQVDVLVINEFPGFAGYIKGAVIDPENGYAFFATYTHPSNILKIDINPANFSYVESLKLSYGPAAQGELLVPGFIYNNYIYWASNTPAASAQLHKIGYNYSGAVRAFAAEFNQNSFTKTGELALKESPANEFGYYAVVKDTAGYLYYASRQAIYKYDPTTDSIIDVLYLPFDTGIYLLIKNFAVIDNVNGYAYFAATSGDSFQRSWKNTLIHRVRLSDFSLRESYTLPMFQIEIGPMAIDTSNNILYAIGRSINYQKPHNILKIDINPSRNMALVDRAEFDGPINSFVSLHFDSVNQALYAIQGRYITSNSVFKFEIDSLGKFIRSPNIDLDSEGLSYCNGGVFDQANGFLYVLCRSKIGKIDTENWLYDSTITVGVSRDFLSGVIDFDRGFLYAIPELFNLPIEVYKVDLSSFSFVGSPLILGSGEKQGLTIELDQSNSYAYISGSPRRVAGGEGYGHIIKVDIRDPVFSRISRIEATDNRFSASAAIGVDKLNNHGFLLMDNDSAVAPSLSKVDLNTMALLETIDLPGTYVSIWDMPEVDEHNGYLYVSTYDSGATTNLKIVKIDTGNLPGRNFEVADFVELGHSYYNSMAIDYTDQADPYGYLVVYGNPAKVIKVRLNDLTLVDELTFEVGEEWGESIFLDTRASDPANHYAYVFLDANPVKIVKIKMSDLSRVSALNIPGFIDWSGTHTFDLNAGFIYKTIRDAGSQGMVLKINVNHPNFSHEDTLVLQPFFDSYLYCGPAVIDQDRGLLYITSNRGIIVVRLSDFSYRGHQAFRSKQTAISPYYFWPIALDKNNNLILATTNYQREYIIKLKPGNFASSDIKEFNVYSHQAGGNVRLAVYDMAKNKIWESNSRPNNATESWLNFPVNSGTPRTLNLKPGVYLLAVQTDSSNKFLSFTGFSDDPYSVFASMKNIQNYGSFPAILVESPFESMAFEEFSIYGVIIEPKTSGLTIPEQITEEEPVADGVPVPAPEIVLPEGIEVGDVIKTEIAKTVYLVTAEGKKRPFPNETVWYSYYTDFSNLKVVSDEIIEQIPSGKNVTLRAGTYLLKIPTDPKVYAVEPSAVLRWIPSETIAANLYGPNWTWRVIDLPEELFADYIVKEDITAGQHPTGALIQYAGTSEIYYIDQGQRRIVLPSVFSANMFRDEFVTKNLNASDFDYLTGEPLPEFIDFFMAVAKNMIPRPR